MPLASFREVITDTLLEEVRGELASGDGMAGEAESDGVLNGWKDIEVRRPATPVIACCVGREVVEDRWTGAGRLEIDDVGLSAPMSWAFRSAEMGLEPAAGPTWWKVDRLPYA